MKSPSNPRHRPDSPDAPQDVAAFPPGLFPAIRAHLLLKAMEVPESDDPRLIAIWERFLDEFAPFVRGRAAKVGLQIGVEVDDAIQEAFTVWLSRLPSFHLDPSRAGLKAWTVATVTGAVLQLVRRDEHEPVVGASRSLPPELADDADSPERLFFTAEDREILLERLNSFRERGHEADYLIIRQTWFEERPDAEIAESLGISRGALRTLRHRALERFSAFFRNNSPNKEWGGGMNRSA